MKTRAELGTILVAAVVAAAFAALAAEPLARFGVISDIHLLPSDPHRLDVLRDALKYMDCAAIRAGREGDGAEDRGERPFREEARAD